MPVQMYKVQLSWTRLNFENVSVRGEPKKSIHISIGVSIVILIYNTTDSISNFSGASVVPKGTFSFL